jgi:hypothetical protein
VDDEDEHRHERPGRRLARPSSNVSGTKYVFATMGNNTKTFKRYGRHGQHVERRWTNVPQSVKGGGALTTDGTNLYLVTGNGHNFFYRYNVGANTWTLLANLPNTTNTGSASVYLGGYVYVLRGKTTNSFYRYSISGATWSTKANAPGTVPGGGALTTDGHLSLRVPGRDDRVLAVQPGHRHVDDPLLGLGRDRRGRCAHLHGRRQPAGALLFDRRLAVARRYGRDGRHHADADLEHERRQHRRRHPQRLRDRRLLLLDLSGPTMTSADSTSSSHERPGHLPLDVHARRGSTIGSLTVLRQHGHGQRPRQLPGGDLDERARLTAADDAGGGPERRAEPGAGHEPPGHRPRARAVSPTVDVLERSPAFTVTKSSTARTRRPSLTRATRHVHDDRREHGHGRRDERRRQRHAPGEVAT